MVDINKEEILKRFQIKKDNYHEFQIIGKEISDYVGEPAYFLFSRYSHQKIVDAFEALKKKKIRSIKYLAGIIKRL